MRNDQKSLLLAAAIVAGLWLTPQLRLAVMPVVYFNTHVHELGHALAALLTGGRPEHILVHADGSGLTPIRGGNLWIMALAGYVGSSIAGGLLVLGGAGPAAARRALWTALVLLSLSMAFWVRGDGMGILSGLFWIVVLAILATRASSKIQMFASQFLGLQLCATSFAAFADLVVISSRGEGATDARTMQDLTHIPAILWSILWLGLGATVVFFSLRTAWSGRASSTRRIA